MKRLPAQIGITYFSVLAAAFYLPRVVTAVLGGIAVLLTVVFFCVGNMRKTIYLPAMAIAALLACVFNLGYTYLTVEPLIDRYAGSEHVVEARLTDEPYHSYAKTYYRLETIRIDGEKVKCRLLLKMPREVDAQPDDVLTFYSELSEIENTYYRSKGYYLMSDRFEVEPDVTPAQTHRLYYYAIQVRQYMRKALTAYLPEDCSSLCRAVLVADKYALDLSVRDHFRYAGASYFIVVSGMHFAVVYLLVERLLKRTHNRWVNMIISVLFVLFYMAVTGFQSSVLRSGVMILFLIFGRFIRRITYSLNHLGLAGLIIPAFLSPYGAGDVGLILSFYATMSILLWAEPIAHKLCYTDENGDIPQFHPVKWIRVKAIQLSARLRHAKPPKIEEEDFSWLIFGQKIRNFILAQLSVSLAANILVCPIMIFIFREISLVTLLSSLLLYWPIYIILIVSLFLCLLFYLKPLAVLCAWILIPLCRYVLWMVELLGSLPLAFIRIGSVYPLIWMAVTIVLGVMVIAYRNGYRYLRLAAFASAAVLLAGYVTHGIIVSQQTMLEVYACGDGVCVGLNSGGVLHLLSLDATTDYLYGIMDDLTYRYGSAETALCCDDDELYRYRLYREDEFAISQLLLYDSMQSEPEPDDLIRFSGDSAFVLDDTVTLSVSVQNGVAVPYLTVGERTVLLLPEGCGLENIPPERRQADVIILSQGFAGVDQLHCRDLIISNSTDEALRTAALMPNCFERVMITDTEDIFYRLG